MPTYDYRCTKCGREIEVMHGIHATGPEACEACGSAMLKVLSPPAIHFKGSGWAKKDAAASSKKAPPKASSSSTSETAKNGSDSKDAGPGSTEKAAASSSTTEAKSSAGATKAD